MSFLINTSNLEQKILCLSFTVIYSLLMFLIGLYSNEFTHLNRHLSSIGALAWDFSPFLTQSFHVNTIYWVKKKIVSWSRLQLACMFHVARAICPLALLIHSCVTPNHNLCHSETLLPLPFEWLVLVQCLDVIDLVKAEYNATKTELSEFVSAHPSKSSS